MIKRKLQFFFIFISCINLVQSVKTMETDPLLGRNSAPPNITVARPQLTNRQKVDFRLLGLSGIALEAGGAVWLGLDPNIGARICGPFLVAGGIALHSMLGYLLWKTYRKEPAQQQFVIQINNQLQRSIHKITNKRLAIAREDIETLRNHLIEQNSAEIKNMITNIDVLSIEPDQDAMQQYIAPKTKRLSMLLFCLRLRQVSRDLRYKIVAQCPELITDQQMFGHALPHVWGDDQLNTWLQTFPLQWFSNYYRLKCGKEYKVDFSHAVAHTATEVRMNTIFSFLPDDIHGQFTPKDHRNMQNTLFNKFKNRLTYEPHPEV